MRVFSVLVLFVALCLFMAEPGRAETLAETRANAEQGDEEAQFNLGVMYAGGQGVPQDSKQAVAWYRKAAEQGYAEAQFCLGEMYHRGLGVPQDYAQAAAWYRKAAEQGYAGAQHGLAFAYSQGLGVPQDYAQAAAWYSKAAEQGYPKAQLGLGLMYEEGKGVTQDYNQAIYWYRKSAEQGYFPPHPSIWTIYEDQAFRQRDRQGAAWSLKPAEQGDAMAQSNLGVLSNLGSEVEKDETNAVAWSDENLQFWDNITSISANAIDIISAFFWLLDLLRKCGQGSGFPKAG